MNKIKLACVLCFLAFGVAAFLTDSGFAPVAHSYSSQPPPQMTGAPGEQTCALCHDEAPGPGTLTIAAPTNYTPGQTYQIQVQHATTDATRMRWGFEMTALDGTNTMAGTFTDTTAFTQQDFGDGRWYIEHNTAGTFAGTSNGATWTFDWNAPATDVGPVTFYAAGNQANNNNNPSGDQTYLTTSVTNPAGSPTPTPGGPLNAITSFDSALIAKHGISSPPLTGNKLGAAEVSGDCSVTSLDAGQIANYVTNNGLAMGTTGTTITPPGPCGTLPIDTSVLMGDVSGTLPITTAGSGSASASIPNISATPKHFTEIPIIVSDLTGLGVLSYDIQITYDPSVVMPHVVTPVLTAGTISAAMTVTANTTNAGHLIISAYGDTALTGSGALLVLQFGTSFSGTTALTFEDYTDSGGAGSHFHHGFMFNEGTPTVTLTNGSITLLGSPTPTNTPTPSDTPSISGTITYGNAIGSPAPPRFVKNVSVASTVGSPAVGPVITGTPGTYTLTGFGSGSYTIKPTKPGGSNGAINSFDAGRVAQGVSGAVPFVSNNQRFAADVTGNGGVTSQDAAKIAQFAAGLPFSPPNFSGEWRFFTSDLPAFPAGAHPQERTYASVTGNVTGEDYIGILIGEVSGNWNPANHARPADRRQDTGDKRQETESIGPVRGIEVELTQVAASTEKEIIIPVNVQGIAGKKVISYEFDLRYDPSVIQPIGNAAYVEGTVSRGLSVVANPYEPGLLRVVVYGAFPIDENGVLLNLRFTPIGSIGSVSALTFERIMFNDGEPIVVVMDGRVETSAPAVSE